MALFGIETEKSEKVLKWFSESRERGESDNLIKNPFELRSKFFLDEKITLVMDITPVWPNLTVFGWIMSLTVFMFWGIRWFIIPGLILGSLGIFWSWPFYYFMATRGIRKAGYKGPIKFLTNKQIINRVVL